MARFRKIRRFFASRPGSLALLGVMVILLLAAAGCKTEDAKASAKDKTRTAAATPVAAAAASPEGTPTPKTRVGPISVIPDEPSATPSQEAQSYRLKIPLISVDAPIMAVGLDKDGAIQEPNNPDLVVWYDKSALPGWPGNSILSGHLDWKTSTAVFWRLKELKPGDSIYVQTTNNNRYRFVVEWSEIYRNDSVPMSKVFAELSEPSLTIITCGGVFNRDARDYSDRLIVRAVGY